LLNGRGSKDNGAKGDEQRCQEEVEGPTDNAIRPAIAENGRAE
jgi:hypothetical protein